MRGTTTVTPQLNVSHWRARNSSASVPLVTEEMDGTVTVLQNLIPGIYQCCGGLGSKALQAALCTSLVSPHHTGTKLKTVEAVASVFHHHLPLLISSRPLPVNSAANKGLQHSKLMHGPVISPAAGLSLLLKALGKPQASPLFPSLGP